MGRAWLAAALASTSALVGLAAVLQLLAEGPEAAPLPQRIFGVLVAAGGADVAVLLRRRAPGPAWFAAVASAGIAAVQVVGGLRDAGFVTDGRSTTAGLAVGLAALVTASAVAVLYAARPWVGTRSAWERVGVASTAVAAAAAAVAAAWTLVAPDGQPTLATGASEQLTPLRLTGRLALLSVMVGLGVGAVRELQPGLGRAWGRWRSHPPGAIGRRPSLVAVLAEEVLPWRAVTGDSQAARAAAEAEARERERARLAADLHALVLPDLRRAAAMAQSTAAPAPVLDGVRRALDDVERLMHERQSIVLEEFGLVAALEWLAERTEGHTSLRVELELDGDLVDRRDGVRADIARAAFRIALLALDNAARHANAATATLGLRVDDASGVKLVITDDGQGVADTEPGTVRSTSGGRGLADMRREATASGGRLRVEMTPSVRVEATWPAG